VIGPGVAVLPPLPRMLFWLEPIAEQSLVVNVQRPRPRAYHRLRAPGDRVHPLRSRKGGGRAGVRNHRRPAPPRPRHRDSNSCPRPCSAIRIWPWHPITEGDARAVIGPFANASLGWLRCRATAARIGRLRVRADLRRPLPDAEDRGGAGDHRFWLGRRASRAVASRTTRRTSAETGQGYVHSTPETNNEHIGSAMQSGCIRSLLASLRNSVSATRTSAHAEKSAFLQPGNGGGSWVREGLCDVAS
jgi:hypothetical protein